MGRDLTRVLVTGAAGYLGAKVLQRLGAGATGCARRAAPGLESCDLTDRAATVGLIDRLQPDVVVHCASTITLGGEAGRQRADAAANIAMVENLLAAGVTRIVFTSSMTVYSPRVPMPAREEDSDPQSEYGRSKLAGERLLNAAPGVLAVSLRLPGLFGPPRRAGLVYNLLRALQRGETPALPAEPLMWATMHVDDAAEAIVRVAGDLPKASQTVNVGYPVGFAINRLARELARRYGRSLDYAVEHPPFEADLSRLRAGPGLPAASFEERLAEMAGFVRDDPA